MGSLVSTAPMRAAVVAQRPTPTNERLGMARVGRVAWESMTPAEALAELAPGDVALGRLDVLPTLDGVDEGLWALGELAARGVRVLNPPAALLAAHDKLITARLLRRARLPHPRTRVARLGAPLPALPGPWVVKPRFGSWGLGVARCAEAAELHGLLERLEWQPWFRAHGALVQELVPPRGHDLRLVVAAGRVVGAVSRVCPPGEWRTNVALGARRQPVRRPPAEACAIAVAAAAAAGADLVGVDLLPCPDGGWTVIELNGAVEFNDLYDPDGDVFASAAFELSRLALGCPGGAEQAHVPARL